MSRLVQIRLERLLGRLLVDAYGGPVGVIEDVEAHPEGHEYVVSHVVVGPAGRLPRLRAVFHLLPTLRALKLGQPPRVRRVPWEWLDLQDPDHPRLLPRVPET
jgi:hypothetical protein